MKVQIHITLFVALLAVYIAAPSLAAPITEDFEDAVGSTLADDGWVNQVGTDAANYNLATPSGSANTSSTVGQNIDNNGGNQIRKPFDTTNDIQISDGHVYFGAWMNTTSVSNFISTKIHLFPTTLSGTTPLGPGIGMARVSPTGGEPKLSVTAAAGGTTYYSDNNFDEDDWYELRLEMYIDQDDITQTRGTLLARNVTDGELELQPVDGLINVDLGLTSGTNPTTWAQWYVRNDISDLEFDNLTFGVIPEPGTLSILPAMALLIVGRRRRHMSR